MRCNNCGWDNPANSERCEKCNAPIKGSMERQGEETPSYSNDAPILGTVKGVDANLPYLDNPVEDRGEISQETPQTQQTCSNCGFPVHQNATKCPQCGNILSPADKENPKEQPKKKVAGTINPWDKPKYSNCFLKPLTREGETEFKKIEFTGDEIDLKRENLEQNNMTITSQVQAVLKNIEGKWYIENKSALQTTFLLLSDPVELKKGDIILMGDRKFEFDF